MSKAQGSGHCLGRQFPTGGVLNIVTVSSANSPKHSRKKASLAAHYGPKSMIKNPSALTVSLLHMRVLWYAACSKALSTNLKICTW
jgi:hypothetical protein